MLRQAGLLRLHRRKPLLQLVAGNAHLLHLVIGDVAEGLSGVSHDAPVLVDRAADTLYALRTHLRLPPTSDDLVACAAKTLEPLDEHGLRRLRVVVKPVFGLVELCGEGRAALAGDVLAVLAAICDLPPHIQHVGLQVVPLCVGLEDLPHLRLHRCLGACESLEGLLVQARRTRGDDRELRPLRPPLRLPHLHPLRCGLVGARARRAAARRSLALGVVAVVGPLLGLGVCSRGLGRRLALLRLPRTCWPLIRLLAPWRAPLLLHDLLVLLLLKELRPLDLKRAMQRELRPHLHLLRLLLRRQVNPEAAQLLRG
mmetsp:Transcript_104147/g.301282  ORF Transcript_104147/g.301282 Transcript_104147/m.301282 type:complete len:313 (+) Transcript_104147:303-1241(+)